MVAIFTGLGAGFERGSGSVLGGAGLLGSASLGRNKEQVLLNAATGNLMISQQDEFLVGLGPDSAIGRTYNSIESVSDGDNGDHWRQSTTRAVHGLTGTLNTAGSTIKRTSGDGSDITYTYQTINGTSAYFTTDGSGAYDKLVNASGVWTWTDGDTQSTETYAAYGTDNWRITQAANVIGLALTFTYTGANLTQVTTQDGSYEQYSWSGGNITQIVTGYTDLATSTAKTLTRTRYGYDTSNRLTTVTVDLTPGDNSVSDGATYVTTYNYDGTSTRVASISETDGSSVAIHYDSSGRVDTLTQTVATGVTRVSTIAYASGSTTITDSLGQVTTLDYNSDGSLKKVTSPPAYSGATAQVTQFAYTADGKGNLLSVTDALGGVTSYTYDGSGNVLTVTDPLNNVVTRTYGSLNEMLTETRTGSDAGSAGANHTTRYIYGILGNDNVLSAKIDAQGRVTVYQYTTINGVPTDSLLNEKQYNDAFYDISTLSPTDLITSSQLSGFLAGMSTKANTVTTNYQRDARGDVTSIRTTSSANASAGGGDTTQPYAVTNYVYDQAGQLLSRTATGFNTETFVYDGMGRITAATDLNGGTTSFVFNDATMQTVVTLASGLTQTAVYNKAGELVSFTESGSNVTGGTATYAYDQRGKLRITTDATGHNAYIVYDKTGRKIADVDHYGHLTEYKYDADNRLVATIRYTNAITSTQLTTLQDPNSNVEMSTLRPAATSTDLWTWKIYDADGRAVEAIDGAGDVTTYQYDASSRLVGTIVYANKLTSTQLSTIQATLPTSAVLPTADSAHDSVARDFYDKTGLLIGVLDGEGYLTSFTYDNVGRKIAQTAFATATTSGLRASGTFSSLLASVGTSTADRTTRYIYDGQSHLRFQIDALNHVTEYVYDSGTAGQASVLRETIQYAGAIGALSDYKIATVKTAVAVLASDTNNRKSWAVYDTAGRLAYSIDATGAVTGYTYDTLGNVIKTVRFATLRATTTLPDLATLASWQAANTVSTDRITRNYYSARNELRYTVDAEGYVTRIDYDAEGRAITSVRWDTAIATTDSTTIANVASLATGTSTTTSTAYDNDGRVASTTDGTNIITSYVYNNNGTLNSTYQAYGLADQVRTTYSYDNAGRKTGQSDAYGATEQANSSVTYDGLGDVLTSTDANGNVTNYTYDRLGRVLTKTDALGGVVHYQYDAFGDAVLITDERGNATYNYYDQLGRLIATRDPLSLVTENSYTAFGELASVTRRANAATNTASVSAPPVYVSDSARDVVVGYQYDKVGRVVAKTDALNATTNLTLDAFGDVLIETDPLDTGTTIQTTRTYDHRGLLKTEVVDSATGGTAISTSYGYDAFGRAVTLTDPASQNTTKAYDRDGRVHTSTDALGHVTTYSYDDRGNLAAVQDAAGNVTRYAYDQLDRLVYSVDALGDVTQNSYDADGNLTLSRSYATPITPGALATVTTVSAVAALVTTAAGDAVTHSVYDADGRLRYSFDAANYVTEYDYDAGGNAIRSIAYTAALTPSAYTVSTIATALGTPPGDARITRNVYDADNQRTYTIDALGNVTAYGHDAFGNVTRQQLVAAIYTATGDPSDATMATWVTANSNATNDRVSRAIYDQNGRLRFDVDAEGYVTQYSYNAAGSVRFTTRYGDRFDGTSGHTAFADGTTLAQAITYVASTPTNPAAITQFQYDTAGRLIITIDPVGTITKLTLNQLGQATTTEEAYSTADSSITTRIYDALGRLTSVTRGVGQPEMTTTTYRYDALGRVTGQLRGNGSAVLAALPGTPTQAQIDAVYASYGTTYTYDANGHVLTTTVALDATLGTKAVTTERYDAFGRLTGELTGVGSAALGASPTQAQVNTIYATYGTTYTYDADGNVHTTTVALNATTGATAVTTNSYDAFGNLVTVVDPRGNTGYFYYDALNRLTLQVDPEGYATATSYTQTGKTATITRYLAKASWTGAPSATNRPAVTADALHGDSVSSFTYDKLDRVTATQQVASYNTTTSTYSYIGESYTYDAFGNRLTVVNKLGGKTVNTFDLDGRLLSEVIQTNVGATVTASVTNTYAYDARGNRKQMVEAFGTGAARTTTYTYDKLDRLSTTTHDSVTVTSGDLAYTTTAAPSEMLGYDLDGNLVRTIDASFTSTYYFYDSADRKIAEVDAAGTLTNWTYDANGNVSTATVYGDRIGALLSTAAPPPAPIDPTNYRTTTYAYDSNNRLISTTGMAAKTGYFDGTNYIIATTAPVSTVTYDANGNVIVQTDANGGTIQSWYNTLGQQVAQVDQENYLTTWVRDANGNVISETRYATKITGSYTSATSVAALQALAGTSSDDRTTTFTYDAAARRLTETRLGVVTLSNTSGTPTTSLQNSQIVYTYNALGEVLTKTEAGGDTTTYTYDAIGRTLTEVDPQHANQASLMVAERTTYTYDGLNNVLTKVVDDALGHSGGAQHTTTYTYDVAGRMASMTDPDNVTHQYLYDVNGRMVGDYYTRTPTGGTAFTEVINYRYDYGSRLVYQTVAHRAIGTATWIFDADSTQIRYNGFGDVTGKGMNGLWQETYDYDVNGHVWRSTAGDGSARIYLYDKNGNATLTIASAGSVDFSASTLDAALNLFTNTNAWAVGSHAVAGAVVTFDRYDKRNQDVETRQPFRELNPNATNPAVYDTQTISNQRGYNAFGEVAWEWSARYDQGADTTGAEKTLYTYNTMGRVIEKQSPTVSVTAENGGISSVRPTEYDYYDISGRLLAVTDANNHTSRRVLLAGSGHGDATALVTSDIHADSSTIYTSYDVFGNAITVSDGLGTTGTHIETRAYDANGNMVSVLHLGGLLTDYYAYDELNHQTQHWNSQFTSGVKDLTSYDWQGRITSQVIAAGSPDAITTGYSYAYVAPAGATPGYWLKTTINSTGLPATEHDDYFGRVLTRTDFGGHVFSYTYDYAGRLTTQTNTAGENLVYSYYNTGRIAKIVTGTDNGWSGETATSQYAYDVDGNRVHESHAVTGHWYDYYYGSAYTYTTSYEDAVTTWDAMNRMATFTDSGSSAPASITYEYDAVGNVRHMNASYRALDDQGNVATTATTQDYWYLYDSMNRFTTTEGIFTGTRGTTGAITRGTTGTDITYDPAGRRATATGTTTLYWSGWKAHMKNNSSWYWYEDEEGDWGEPISVLWAPVSNVAFQGTYQDTYTYRDDGQLMSVSTATQEGVANGSDTITGGAMGSAGTTGTYVRDALGRVTSYTAPGYSATSTYDYLNELTSQSTTTVRSDGTYYASTTNDYRAETYAGSGVWTGTYQGGAVVHSRTTTTKGTTAQPTTDTKTTLTWWDGAENALVTFTPDIGSPGTTNSSTYYYDDAGRIQSVYIQDGRSRTVSFVNNAEGQILSRDEADSLGTGDPRELHYYFNGERLGDISNNGTSNIDYVTANAQRTKTSGTGPFAGGSATDKPYADFDQSYDPINGLNYTSAASRYTVNSGDTLTSIATALWGDQSLWYLLADANGLTGSETLPAGMSLIVPANVQNTHNSSSTFRPYDPSQAVGDLSPTAPKPAPKSKNCGVFGAILMIVIAVAVVAILHAPIGNLLESAAGSLFGADGALGIAGTAIASGAIAGAAGSVVSQGFGIAAGIQDKFSWKGVALAAIGGAVSGGVSGIKGLDGLTQAGDKVKGILGVTSAIGRAVIGNVATQGIGLATGLQTKFDWTGIATSAVAGGVGQVVGNALHVSNAETVSNKLVIGLSNAAGAIAGAATRSVIDGSDFGDNIMAALPDAIGQTIGSLVALGVSGGGRGKQPDKSDSGGGPATNAGAAAVSTASDAQPSADAAAATTLNAALLAIAAGQMRSYSPQFAGDAGNSDAAGNEAAGNNVIGFDNKLTFDASGNASVESAPVTSYQDGEFHFGQANGVLILTRTDPAIISVGIDNKFEEIDNQLTFTGRTITTIGADGKPISSVFLPANTAFSNFDDGHGVKLDYQEYQAPTPDIVVAASKPHEASWTDPLAAGYNYVVNTAAHNNIVVSGLNAASYVANRAGYTTLGTGLHYLASIDEGVIRGTGRFVGSTVSGVYGAVTHPVQTITALGKLGYKGLQIYASLEAGDARPALQALSDIGDAVKQQYDARVDQFNQTAKTQGMDVALRDLSSDVTQGGLTVASVFVPGGAEIDGVRALGVANDLADVGKLGDIGKLQSIADTGATVNAAEEVGTVGARTIDAPFGCFVAGTLVHTPSGPVPIETLRAGDFVLSQPELTGERAPRRIVETFAFDDKAIYAVSYRSGGGDVETIHATPNHPFWVQGIGWTAAEFLQSGHELQLANGDAAVVSSVTDTGTRQTVFNFEVDGYHTYYVGGLGVWVHNTNCARITPGSLPAVEEQALSNTLRHIDAGTVPADKTGVRWGIQFENRANDLPGGQYASSPYLEYRVAPPAGTKGAGPYRVVRDNVTGDTYYTWTHYGDSGNPPFVQIR